MPDWEFVFPAAHPIQVVAAEYWLDPPMRQGPLIERRARGMSENEL